MAQTDNTKPNFIYSNNTELGGQNLKSGWYIVLIVIATDLILALFRLYSPIDFYSPLQTFLFVAIPASVINILTFFILSTIFGNYMQSRFGAEAWYRLSGGAKRLAYPKNLKAGICLMVDAVVIFGGLDYAIRIAPDEAHIFILLIPVLISMIRVAWFITEMN